MTTKQEQINTLLSELSQEERLEVIKTVIEDSLIVEDVLEFLLEKNGQYLREISFPCVDCGDKEKVYGFSCGCESLCWDSYD